jgi:hypothetical protein
MDVKRFLKNKKFMARVLSRVTNPYPAWINGNEFELFAITLGKKASNGSRRCRELADEGTFERRMNAKSVEYRYLQKDVQKNPTNYRCRHCSKDAVTLKNIVPFCQEHLVKSLTPASLFQVMLICVAFSGRVLRHKAIHTQNLEGNRLDSNARLLGQ